MRIKNLTVLWPTLVVLILDQLTKLWVRSNMTLGESFPLLGEDFFRLTHVENSGIAFGLRAGTPLFLILFNAVASIAILYFILSSQREGGTALPKSVNFSLTLILGGAIGNLIDRILYGRVTDFLDVDFPDFIMMRWPTFNIADSAVTIGVTLWCLHLLFSAKSKAVQPPSSDDELTSR